MTGIIILAAGNSSRMGKVKQLLEFSGQSLLNRIILTSVSVAQEKVVVVLGAYWEEIMESVTIHDVHIAFNKQWHTGMAGSIQTGLKMMLDKHSQINQVILVIADQPYVSADLLKKMIICKENDGKSIVACSYNETVGTPVLFDRTYFKQLQALKGRQGAKTLLHGNSDVEVILFPKGGIDIDTAEDYDLLCKTGFIQD